MLLEIKDNYTNFSNYCSCYCFESPEEYTLGQADLKQPFTLNTC